MDYFNIKKTIFIFSLCHILLYAHNIIYMKSFVEAVEQIRFAGEKLNYSITWENFVNAGTATLSINKVEDHFEISTVAISAEWLNLFGIRVKDVISAESNLELTKSFNFKAEIMEGNFKKTKTIDFNHSKNELIYIDAENSPKIYPLPPMTFDVLTALFVVRTKAFELGKDINVNVFDDKKWYIVKIRVLKKEIVKFGKKEIRTFKTQVLLKTSGLFNRKGDLFIWFTEDKKRIPVLVKSRISFGSFYATLTNLEML